VTTDGLSVIFTSAFVEFGRRRLRLGVVRIEFIFKVEIDVEVVHGWFDRSELDASRAGAVRCDHTDPVRVRRRRSLNTQHPGVFVRFTNRQNVTHCAGTWATFDDASMRLAARAPATRPPRATKPAVDGRRMLRRRDLVSGFIGVGVVGTWKEEAKAVESTETSPTGSFVKFNGKSAGAIGFEYPETWVKAIDREYGDAMTARSGTTVAMIGNFKTIDTVSVRVETLSETTRNAIREADGDALTIAEALTANERAAVDALESFGVVGGVENGRSGTMAFELDGRATKRVDSRGRTYYVFGYGTEVCRAKIEEGMGGAKICVGPQGDLLDSIKRRSLIAVTFVGDTAVKLHASAVDGRFEGVRDVMERAVDSFVLNV
jgi:hypothetical protein